MLISMKEKLQNIFGLIVRNSLKYIDWGGKFDFLEL